jgi:hypothetical protein
MAWALDTNIKGPKGDKGDPGQPGGPPGPQGPPGTNGTNGVGVPVGGTTGQVLSKIDATNYNTTWVNQTGGGGGAASGITFTPGGNVAATNVQAAIIEVDSEKVAKAGDTMTGPLVLPGNPTTALQAATKQYVDGKAPPNFAQDAAPTTAADNSLWFETVHGVMYWRYNDGDSQQWVVAAPPASALANAVRFDAPQGLTRTQQTQARDNIAVQKKNYIINGAMMISQENGLTAGNITAAGYYGVDCFGGFTTGTTGVAGIQQAVSATPAGSSTRLRLTVTTADAAVGAGDIVWIATRLEGVRILDLRFGSAAAKTVTLQFGVKAPAGTYSVTLINNAINRSYVAEYVIAAGEANTDVIKSATIPGDITGTWTTDTSIGIEIRWGMMVGTTWQQTAGAWGTVNAVGSPNQFNFMGTNGNVFELFDVSLTEGSVAPPFVVPDYASELLACKRYFYNGVPPLRGTVASATSAARLAAPHPVTMCRIPNLTITSPLPAYDGTTLTTVTISSNNVTTTVLEFDGTLAAALTVGRPAMVYQQGGGNINVNARL